MKPLSPKMLKALRVLASEGKPMTYGPGRWFRIGTARALFARGLVDTVQRADGNHRIVINDAGRAVLARESA